jgi:hypothetical protein
VVFINVVINNINMAALKTYEFGAAVHSNIEWYSDYESLLYRAINAFWSRIQRAREVFPAQTYSKSVLDWRFSQRRLGRHYLLGCDTV